MASTGVWTSWTDTGTTSTASGTDIWASWTETSTTCTACTTDSTAAWSTWVKVDSDRYYEAPQRSVAQRLADGEEHEAAREAARLRNEEREQKSKEAKERAMELLRSMLTVKQQKTLEKEGFFEVFGQSGKRYKIKDAGTMGNVIAVDFHGKNKKQRICAHPKDFVDGGRIPQGDIMLGQMLALQADEERFLKVANLH